jgi:hypothetical protein
MLPVDLDRSVSRRITERLDGLRVCVSKILAESLDWISLAWHFSNTTVGQFIAAMNDAFDVFGHR